MNQEREAEVGLHTKQPHKAAHPFISSVIRSRPDLLPPAYLLEFEQLQDRIPPFSNEKAFARECVCLIVRCDL